MPRRKHKPYAGILAVPMTYPIEIPEAVPDDLRKQIEARNSKIWQREFHERYEAAMDHYDIPEGSPSERGWNLLTALLYEYVPGFRYTAPRRRPSVRSQIQDIRILIELHQAKARGRSLEVAARTLAKNFQRDYGKGPSAKSIRTRYYELAREHRPKS